MNAKLALAAAALLAAGAAFAQDRSNPDGNTDTQNPYNPVPQGAGAPPFGGGQPAGTHFDKGEKVDSQTAPKPTDRRAAPTDKRDSPPETETLETNPTPSRPDMGAQTEQTPAPKSKKSKKRKRGHSREQLEKKRSMKGAKTPNSPADKELPAVTDPGKDGALIDDTPQNEVPHD